MSLNELVSDDYKPWLNVRANNVIIDGDLSVRNSFEGYVLGYGFDGNVSFGPQLNIVNLDMDAFALVPVQNVADNTKLNFALGPIPENNFTLNPQNNLRCMVSGVYILIFKFVEAQNSSTIGFRPNPYLRLNNVNQSTLSLRVPLCTQTFSSYSGSQMSSIFTVTANDVLSIQFATQPPSGTSNMMNEYFASNLILVKIA